MGIYKKAFALIIKALPSFPLYLLVWTLETMAELKES